MQSTRTGDPHEPARQAQAEVDGALPLPCACRVHERRSSLHSIPANGPARNLRARLPGVSSVEGERMRGYFAIGVHGIKRDVNVGTLWRSAYIFGAAFIFTIERRYEKQASDTVAAFRHVPLFHFLSMDEFLNHIPHDCQLICIENNENAISLKKFDHPERAIYLLGAEDKGIPDSITTKHKTIIIESARSFSLNLATAGTIVIYDRYIKRASPRGNA